MVGTVKSGLEVGRECTDTDQHCWEIERECTDTDQQCCIMFGTVKSGLQIGRECTDIDQHCFLVVGTVEVWTRDRLVGLVFKAFASTTEELGFESRLRRDFSGSSHTSELKIGTTVATLPDVWRYRVSAGTGRAGVSIL